MPRKMIALLLLSGAAPAFAQQTAKNNVVTQSEDAFGRSVGNERIGIYSNDEVRGFNPYEAGNVRIEGLYAEQGNIVSPRLIASSSIKVGYAARGTAFPAPTGIVDLRIEKFAGEKSFGAEFEFEDNASMAGAVEAKIPLIGKEFGLALGVGFREADQVHGRNGSFRNFLVGASWFPAKDREVTIYSSGFFAKSAEFAPFIYPASNALPPRQPRKLQQSQPWAENRFNGTSSGLIIRQPIAGMKLEAGLFRVTRDEKDWFVTLQLGTQGVGSATVGAVRQLLVLADKGNGIFTNSGEVRLSKVWTGERLRHTLIASVRGRQQDRIYGGQDPISLGASRVGVQDFRPQPVINAKPDDRSDVKQFFYGLQYNLQTRGGSLLSLAIQKADYSKNIDFADVTQADLTTKDSPWLFSANGSVAVTPKLNIYGGYVRGMEDSATAPDIAVNRSEAPPALRTRQMDAGLRYLVAPNLTLIAGVFDIKKPYFGVDAGSRFANLGTVSNRGVELSIAGTLTKGLTLVAGGIVVSPKIKGALVDAGRIDDRPIGSFSKRGIFNLDWKPVGQDAWSFDIALETKGSEVARSFEPSLISNGGTVAGANTFLTPGKFNANLGARYRFKLAGGNMLLRAQILNVTNSYGWRVNSAGGFSFAQPRSVLFHLFADF